MTITGSVMDDAGTPVENAQVLIQSLQLATTTGEDGTYQLFVPAARMAGQTSVQLTARRIGLRAQTVTVALVAGGALTQNFSLAADPFLLEAVIVTGQGMRESRAKLATTISSIRAEDITESKSESNLIAAMAGKAPNVEVSTSSGDPGAGAYIRIRGSKSIEGGTQPLIIVDGVAVTNEGHTIESTTQGTAWANRLIDLNPEDIESIEILKGAAAGGLYGSRATNGVVMITTKSGQRNVTQVTLRASLGFDKVTQLQPLNTRFEQGLSDLTDPSINIAPPSTTPGASSSPFSWGPEISSGTPIYDHANELFETGIRSDNTLSLAGGTDRTTYFLSLGYLYHDGTIIGNSKYKRFTARLKGSHDFLDNLNVEGNFAFTSSDGDLVQQGSNISGLLLGAFRTPPDFNNFPWIDSATGLHRSYRYQIPTVLERGRGYDNPQWVSHEITNEAKVDRYMGNLQIDWDPFSWWDVRYLVGLDFANDQRFTVFPKSSSGFISGNVNRAEFVDRVFDQTVLMSFQDTPSETFGWSLTLGYNMNQTEYRRYQVQGTNVIFGTDQLDFAVDREPNEYVEKVRTEGLFADLGLDLWGQLFLKGGLRYDGSNTFGGDTSSTGEQESDRFWYPKASLAWDFSRYVPFIDFGKLRGAYGVAGVQPGAYSNVTGFTTFFATDGWVSPAGLSSTYKGFTGVGSGFTLGNTGIVPEETSEWEAGADLAILNNSLNLGVTYYSSQTKAAIMDRPIPASTGFAQIADNGAEWRNWGWEVTLDWLPIQKRDFTWRLYAQWATNNSMVDTLIGTEEFGLTGFTGSTSSVVQGHPFPVIYGDQFIRFGRGRSVGGVDIDATYSGWTEGDLYICGAGDPGCANPGQPLYDPQEEVVGDANPDWTGSLRTTFTFFGKLRLSGLLDVKHGGLMWNGTKGALYYFGAHKDTERFHGLGVDTVFTEDTCGTCGPGAGQQTTLNWDTWFTGGPGSGFTGPMEQFVEPSGFVKIRDISLAYTWEAPWLSTIGFDALDVTVSGRNLVTWTDFTGLDPESNLNGQTTGRGLEYFNHPQTRTFVFTLTFRR
jgi:TonB-linked SusC/RagA family outer membrane protein